MRRSLGMKKRAVIYARQSNTKDGSASLDIQLETCRDTAVRFDVEVAADRGFSPVSIIEIPQLIGGVGSG